ncbi:hypothetical protein YASMINEVIRUS_1197 [Yasminevirus sp. GU-2018]|uniref:Uncharacterized protein n=1 Tax=Yasminevirus sp. GU-2018 TaxID=2420051 RepID=A0A5K0UBW0_9VIRU|nr:hypothetical protein YASMINEVIRUS_1197 [Yasminevirus sp. GU-2018]
MSRNPFDIVPPPIKLLDQHPPLKVEVSVPAPKIDRGFSEVRGSPFSVSSPLEVDRGLPSYEQSMSTVGKPIFALRRQPESFSEEGSVSDQTERSWGSVLSSCLLFVLVILALAGVGYYLYDRYYKQEPKKEEPSPQNNQKPTDKTEETPKS